MTIQAVSPKELLRMAVGDLMAERTRDAREKTDFVLQNGIGSELCEALILSIFVFLAEGRPSAAKNISTYLGMTWNQSFLDALMPPLAQALAATSFVKRWFKNGAILESAEWMGANWVGFASRLDSLHSDGQASMPLAFKRAGDRPLAVLGLTGGLGSQMFQYAAGLDWAKRSGAELRIDTRFYRDVQREDRRFWLHQFNITRDILLNCSSVHQLSNFIRSHCPSNLLHNSNANNTLLLYNNNHNICSTLCSAGIADCTSSLWDCQYCSSRCIHCNTHCCSPCNNSGCTPRFSTTRYSFWRWSSNSHIYCCNFCS